VFGSKVLYSHLWVQMERQMSMGSNMMGMQGPAHNSSCSSPHVPPMHSEAKLVSQSSTHTHTHTCIFSCLPILCNLIWDFFYLLFYWYGNIHPYKIHNTSMSIRKLLSFCCSYTCSHTHTSFSFSLNVCQCVRCIS